jgi:hypothetical protein
LRCSYFVFIFMFHGTNAEVIFIRRDKCRGWDCFPSNHLNILNKV